VKGAKGAALLKGVRETTFCAMVPGRHANGGPGRHLQGRKGSRHAEGLQGGSGWLGRIAA
jgi:hypothetical protein